MKRRAQLGITIITMLQLVSCYHNPKMDTPLTPAYSQAQWLRHITLHPKQWTQQADSWFFNGEPNRTELANQQAPATKAITLLTVRVPHFTDLVINGSFQVQLTSNQGAPTLSILGPNAATQMIRVKAAAKTVYVFQKKPAKRFLNSVIVRINIPDLKKLSLYGTAQIYGRNFYSSNLTLISNNYGNTYLQGVIRLSQLTHSGTGSINILGVVSPQLGIDVNGNGNVNIAGRIGVETVTHNGNGNINILGADSNQLTLATAEAGATTIVGKVNLKSIIAKDKSQIYLKGVASQTISITAQGQTLTCLAGITKHLTVNLIDHAFFDGQNIAAQETYAKTDDYSHATLHAAQSAFADAIKNSSIYYYGPANTIIKNAFNNGTVLLIPS